MKETQVYVICDARKPGDWNYNGLSFPYKPFYVGQTRRLASRMLEHLNSLNAISDKMRASLLEAQHVHVETVWSSKSTRESCLKESETIGLIGRKDLGRGPLLNRHAGSQGTSFYAMSKAQKARYKRARQRHGTLKHTTAHMAEGLASYWSSMTQKERSARGLRIARTREVNGSEQSRIEAFTATKRLNAAKVYALVLEPFRGKFKANFKGILTSEGVSTEHKCEHHGLFFDSRHDVASRIRNGYQPCRFCHAEETHKHRTKLRKEATKRRRETRS